MAINPQAIRGPVTAVPVVAGKGVRFVEDVENNRVVAEADETVLWENYTFANNKSSQVVMSETPFNFSCVRITFETETTTESWPTVQTQIIDIEALNNCANKEFTLNGTCVVNALLILRCSRCKFNGTAIQDISSVQWYSGGTEAMVNPLHIYKIVGINRVASA